MKKMLTAALLTTSLLAAPTAAFAGDINVFVDDQKLVFDQPPVVVNSRTLVPLRAIFEALGAKVEWDAGTSTVTGTLYTTKDVITVQLQLGQDTAIVNDQSIKLDAAAQLVNGRTMVPARFVAESLRADVTWVEAEQAVDIWSLDYELVMAGYRSSSKVEDIQALLDLGANPNYQVKDDKSSSLFGAVNHKRADLVKLLLAHKANVNIRDKDDYTPLEIAMHRDDLVTGRLLLEAGADASFKILGKFTLYELANSKGKVDFAKLLTEYGFNK